MAASMAQMGGGAQMRPRPPQQQLSQVIFNTMVSNPMQFNGGWQSQVNPQTRLGNAMNLITNSFLAMPQLESQQLISHGISFEREAYANCPDKPSYDQKIGARIQELFRKRQANEQNIQNTLNAQHQVAQAQAQAQHQMMMSQNALQAQMSRGMGQAPPQGFHQLQQQMQATPLPQQPQQSGMGMPNASAHAMHPNQQAMQMRPQGPQINNLSPQDRAKIQQIAMARLTQSTEAQKNQMRIAMQAQIPPQHIQQLQNNNQDPLLFWISQQLLRNHVKSMNAAGNQGAMQMQPQQRPMNPSGQQPVPPGTDLAGFSNVDIMNQQKAGLMAQEAGQMVVPASGGPGRNATPQPVGSVHGANAGNNQPGPNQVGRPPHIQQQQQQQLHMMQQQAMDQAAQKSQVQIRAQAQQKMQGQPGGLSGPGAVSQSPAMNTLNAPVPRPPVAMNQVERQGQMTQGNAPFGQNMNPQFNQNQRLQMGGGNINPNQQVIQNMLGQMPPQVRQNLQNMPPQFLQGLQNVPPHVLAKFQNNPEELHKFIMQRAQMAGRPQPQPGQFTPPNPMSQFPPGNNAGQQQQGNMNMNPQNPLIVQQHLARIRGNQGRPPMPGDSATTAAMADSMEVPPSVLQKLQGSVPPEVKKWSQLKQWMAQNSYSQQLQHQLSQIQTAQFTSVIRAKAQAGQNQMAQQTGVQPQVPPGPGTQLQQQSANVAAFNNALQNVNVSAQEIQSARTRHEKMRNMPDDQIRNYIVQMKQQQIQKKWSAQMAGHPSQSSQPPQPTSTPIHQPAAGPGSAQRPPNAGADQPGSVAPARNNKPQPPNRPTQGASPAMGPKGGIKRPSSDDVVEVPNPSSTPVQRPASRQSQLTPTQIQNLSADQRAKYEQFLKNRQMIQTQQQQQQQQQPQQQNSEDINRLRAIGQEEQRSSLAEVLQDIPMSAADYADMAQKIKNSSAEMSKIAKGLGRWYTMTHDDARARMFFKLRFRLMKQFKDGDKATLPKETLSIGPADLDQIKAMTDSIVKDVAVAMKMKQNQQSGPDAGVQQGPSAQAGTPASQPAPLSAANLEKNTAVLNKMHRTMSNKSGHGQPPAAPTTSAPPFQFGASSPHGQPAYIGKPTVTQDNLQLPVHARKKARTGPQGGQTPSMQGSSASPQVSKQPSPEMQKRPGTAEPKTPSKPRLQCPEPDCQANNWGFATEEARRTHYEEEHVEPYKDPYKYVMESLELALGGVDGKSSAAPAMVGSLSRQGQVPAAATPMSRDDSVNKYGNTLSSKPRASKPAGSSSGLNAATPVTVKAESANLEKETIDPQDLFQNLGAMETGGGGAISDMNVYRSITPNDTPESSKDGASSEPNSDVSEGVALNVSLDMGFDTWRPFEGDRYINFGANDVDMDMLETGGLTNMGDSVLTDFTSWDDVNIDFNKPFTLDTSLYSLDTA
ncbi:uncharacterized protein BCR38DRAFT_98988 [Pseudomassariella vexata]|uniref:Mediator complex subunit 15 KIX domain-containing protein n=1 Tax=Pseudomassariella vexata TaxID=1141098 RepID=A0A1Y2EF89_9PEZI|nr:uncharacterized protein BCR38DRAFT_98988 [Pseudomassariella vexata]ORY70067.1 hypothetical protein BCR38DRAFT_98988 [Pseudomassariella vexata]